MAEMNVDADADVVVRQQPERQSVLKMYIDRLELSSEIADELEKGVFNWSIDYVKEKKAIPSWGGHLFRNVYLQKALSVMANMRKDESENPYLNGGTIRERVISEEVKPRFVPCMRPEDIRPDRWKDIIERRIKLDQSLGDKSLQEAIKTDMFWCFKCGKNETSYFTMQCRSADESESVFISCLNCPNKWRIG